MNQSEFCRKCLDFVALEQREPIVSRKQILLALEDIFGYSSSCFFLSSSPQPWISHNMDHRMINEYITCYSRVSLFWKNRAQKDRVMTANEWEESGFFLDIMSQYGFAYAADVMLYDRNGTVCIGCISLFRTRRQGDFSRLDREALAWIGQYVESVLHRQMESDRGRDYGLLLEASLQNVQFGYMLLDENYNILFFNAAARDFAGQLASRQQRKPQSRNPIDVVKELVFVKLDSQELPVRPWSVTEGAFQLYGYPVFPFTATSTVSTALKRYVICISRNESSHAGEAGRIMAQYGLTNREREVVSLLQQGYSNQRIAKELCISENTAKVHLRNIYAKMEVGSRAEVLALLHSDRPRLLASPA